MDGGLYQRSSDRDAKNQPPGVYPLVDKDAFAGTLGFLFNTWVSIGYCPECVTAWPSQLAPGPSGSIPPTSSASTFSVDLFVNTTASHTYAKEQVYQISWAWAVVSLVGALLLLLVGTAGVIVESRLVAPDTLGYISTTVRNSRHLRLPKDANVVHGSRRGKARRDMPLTGADRTRALRNVKVMMQDVRGDAQVGKIALGMKTADAKRLQADRLYRY